MRTGKAFQLGLQRLAQEAREELYLRTGRDTTRPLAVQGIVNERCNYKCAFCMFWRLDEYKAEMPLEDWQAALAGLQEWIGNFTIQFAGGEPLIFKPFLPLVEWCHSRGISWGVITNGSALTPDIAERLIAADPINLDISVDGPDEGSHDRLRGVAGSVARIAAGVGRLRAARDRRGSRTALRIKALVHAQNLESLPDMVRWAQETGADTVDFSTIRPWTDEIERELWVRTEAQFEALERIGTRLLELQAAGAPIETEPSRIRSWAAHFRGEVTLPDMAPCRVGLRDFHIMPDGDVRTCWFYPPIGNVRSAAPREIWYGAFAKQQRATMMRCPSFGSVSCASSCLAHRTLRQDLRRGWMWMSRTRKPMGS